MNSAKKSDPIKKFRKGDDVIVLTGKDKGKKGNILRVLHKETAATATPARWRRANLRTT